MSAAAQKLKGTIFSKNFAFGFGLAALFYSLLLTGSFFLNQSSLQSLSNKLASETVAIIRHSMSITPSVVSATHGEDHNTSSGHDTPDSDSHDNAEHAAQDNHHGEATPTKATSHSLPTKPVSGLYELNAKGVVLPIIRQSDNLTPFQAYSAPYERKEGFSQIALIVEDFGLAGAQNRLVQNLPAQTSFIVSPYSANPNKITSVLLEYGHEIWIKAPFENTNFPEDDPGPKGILKRAALSMNQDNLQWVLGRSEVYAGVAGYTDTVFSGANPAINTLSREIINRGLGFFEINVSALPQIRDIAEKLNAPYTKNDIILHDQKWNGQFTEALDLLENIALSRGTAVAVFHAHPEVVALINQWSKSLGRRKIQIAPLSAIIKERNPKFAATLIAAPNLDTSTPNNNKSSHREPSNHDEHSTKHH